MELTEFLFLLVFWAGTGVCVAGPRHGSGMAAVEWVSGFMREAAILLEEMFPSFPLV